MEKKNSGMAIYKLVTTRGTNLLLGLMLIISIVIAACHIGISKILQNFVDIATGVSAKSLREVFLYGITVLLLYATALVVSVMLNSLYINKVERKMRLSIIDHIANANIREFEKYHSSELLTRLTVDIEKITSLLPKFFGQYASEILSAVFALIMMFLINWKMALIMLAIMPIIMIIISLISPGQQNAAKRDIGNEEDNRALMLEILTHTLLFKAYNMADKSQNMLRESYGKRAKSRMKLSFYHGLMTFLNNMMGFALLFITLGAGTVFVLNGEVSVGQLIAMVQMTNYVLLPINSVSVWVKSVNEAKASVQRINEILEIKLVSRGVSHDIPVSNIRNVSIKNISFGYDKNNPILNDVSAVFELGITGLIGESGSGKSTLLKLIMNVYKPDKGKICAADLSMKSFDLDDLVAYVPSDNFIYKSTIADNVIMSSELDMDRLEQALQMSSIGTFVAGLPQKAYTEMNEAGSNISLGQQQRVAIARAIYSGKPILVFDEPTANLDPDATNEFWKTLRIISKDKICIVVTHDMSLAAKCDKVYLLKDRCLAKM